MKSFGMKSSGMKRLELILLLPCLALAGCTATNDAKREGHRLLQASVPETVPLDVNQGAEESAAFNVSIMAFASGGTRSFRNKSSHNMTSNTTSNAIGDSATRVRTIETRYLPVLLKRTLDESAFWGAVRVLPQADPGAEVLVMGRIHHSDGQSLHLHIRVEDATGRLWIDRPYLASASEMDYAMDPSYLLDPFQNLYNQLANDMSQALRSLASPMQDAVLDTALLRYAIDLSPESFGSHLARDESGTTAVTHLPARNDPLFNRVERLRQSEFLFADSVSEHYESLFRRVGETYAWWRHYSHELVAGNRALEMVDATRGATRGSWYAMDRIYHTYKESRMNEDALRELTASFDREASPVSTKIEGQLVELTGTADIQYEEWRRILREIYRQETGL